MNKVIIFLVLALIIFIVAFFVYEGAVFKKYIRTKHESEYFTIPVNKNAPVISSDELVISAPVLEVWKVLSDINNWPHWQKSVTEANLKGEAEEGKEFKWKAGGLSFTSVIHTSNREEALGWTGKTFGAFAVHNWKFVKQNDSTKIIVEESLQGVIPLLFKKSMQKSLDSEMKQNLMELKNASEK